ncbi:MAG: hypothetical protein N2482_01225 [Patescibacteria group bacterium]|nr:hypothetical protein [Patescibacteria group bacterium]
MDNTQLLFTLVLTISTIFLIIIGIQLIFLLKELRLLVKKANLIIGGFEKIGSSLENGLSEIVGFINGIKLIIKAIDVFHKKNEYKNK